MKPALGLKLSQGLALTPALQQAIKLLQMSTMDLHSEIQQLLESNVMLEQADSEPVASAQDEVADSAASSAEDSIPEQPREDFDWDDVYPGTPSRDLESEQALYDFRQASIEAAPDLKTHLQDQLLLLDLDEQQAEAMDFLVDAVDQRGYLALDDTQLDELTRRCGLDDAALDQLIEQLQQCEPSGVGARDLRECLLLQLAALPAGKTRALARMLVRDHLESLAQPKSWKRLREMLPGPAVSEADFDAAVQLIRSLTPDPGSGWRPHEDQYVAPDVYVARFEGRWIASINPDVTPKLRICGAYQDLIKRADNSPDQLLMKQHLQEARYFLHSLKSRNETLLRVAQEIVDQQRGFLEYGPEAMRPMVLRDIAGKLGIHESTVSRTTAHKYMHTPRGLYELKYFFSSAVSTAEGGSCSATAIQAMIRRLVNEENPAKPLSDNRLTTMLQDEGIQVARRTVAKYREALNIPPSHERKRMA